MKTLSSQLTSHIAGEVTTLATCWKITRADSVVKGFTDFDRPLTIDTVMYEATSGFTPTAVQASSDLAVDNMDLDGILNSAQISEGDLLAGKYDHAEIEIFMVNYNDLSQGKLKLRKGWLGEVSLSGQHFVAEVRGLAQSLTHTLGELYSPACRARFCDARCKLNLASYTVTASVTGVTNNQTFAASGLTQESGYFTGGKITFTGGDNTGLSMEVKNYTTGSITLVLPMPASVAVGNGFSIIAGCDKTLKTCKERFDNVINFRGEPHVPGTDRILQTAGTSTFSI